MNVTYLHHSGFSVETETKVLLFDYYTEGARKAYFDPAAYPEKDIFVNRVKFQLQEHGILFSIFSLRI